MGLIATVIKPPGSTIDLCFGDKVMVDSVNGGVFLGYESKDIAEMNGGVPVMLWIATVDRDGDNQFAWYDAERIKPTARVEAPSSNAPTLSDLQWMFLLIDKLDDIGLDDENGGNIITVLKERVDSFVERMSK